jgi:hypothetical protein
MLDNVMVGLALVILSLGAVYVVSTILKEARKHKVYVMTGAVKFACPRSLEILVVAVHPRGIAALPCPWCGKMIKIPDQKNHWLGAEECR